MSPSDVKDAETPLLGRILASGDGETEAASERILAAAIGQIEDFGVRRFTVDDVARRVGLSRVTIYKYFPKKGELVEAVLMRELRRFMDEVDRVVARYDTLEERAVEGFVFGLTFLREHKLLNRLLRTEPELILPLLTVDGAPVLNAGREFIATLARREAKQRTLPIPDEGIEVLSEILARAVVSFVLTPQSVTPLQTEPEIRRFAETYIGAVVKTIAE